MTGTRVAWDIALLLLGGTGLFAGLGRLATEPLRAVLVILSAMAFVMFSAASLCGAGLRNILRQKK